MSTTDFKAAFRRVAGKCEKQSSGLVVYHRTGSAVVKHVNQASVETDWMRVRFEPEMGALRRLGLAAWRFLTGKVSFRHLFVIDTTIPQTGAYTGLDQIVRQLGFQMNAEREVRGSRMQILKRAVISLFAALPVPLVHYLPKVRSHPLFQESELLRWFDENWQYPLVAGILAVPILFIYFEWRANLLGLFRAKSVLTNVEEEVRFIADEVRRRQMRSGLWLFLELPLVYLLVGPLLLMHVLVFCGRMIGSVIGQRAKRRGLGRRISAAPLREHVGWILADVAILAAFWAGCCLQWDAATRLHFSFPWGGNIWGGFFLSSVVFLAMAALRELKKLVARDGLPASAHDRRFFLLAQGLTALVLLGAAVWPWLDPWQPWQPYIRHLTCPALVVLAHTLIAWVRRHTQSPRWVLMRICEVQRLQSDFEPLFKGLCDAIKERLLIVGLWNCDEVPETPTGYEELQDPLLDRDEIFARLQKLFPRRQKLRPANSAMMDLADYIADLTRGLDEPFRRFAERVERLAAKPARTWRLLYQILPVVAADRKALCCVDADELAPAQEQQHQQLISWRRGFRVLEKTLIEKWDQGQFAKVAVHAQDAQEDIETLVDDIASWEEETRRFQLRVLGKSKAAEFPEYVEHLVRLAQFVALNAEESLYFEDQREDAQGTQARSFPSLGVPVSLCLEAGIFDDVPAGRVHHMVEDYQREEFLESADPVIFDVAWLAFLATGYLTVPLLYAHHEQIIHRLALAGHRDHRFLKVASEWAYDIQTTRYWGQLRGLEGELPGDLPEKDRVITEEKAADLAYRSASLLLEYFDAIAHDGIPGVDPDQLQEELDTLTSLPVDDGHQTVSIPMRLAELRQRPGKHAQRLADQLQEKWRRIQIRRFLLRGEFDMEEPLVFDEARSGTPAGLGDLLATQARDSRTMRHQRYDALQTHNFYYRGNIAVERGQPLRALAQLAEAASRARRSDDVLYAKINYYAARCLMNMGLYQWTDNVLEQLYETYGVYLRDDPFFLLLKLEMAKIDAYCWSRNSLITAKVDTRWLEPMRRQASRPDFPIHLKALLKLTQALYEEKRNAGSNAPLESARAAHVLLQDMPTRSWQKDVTTLHVARISRRRGVFAEASDLLSKEFVDRMKRKSRLGYLEACHTLARENFIKAEFDSSKSNWLDLIEAALDPSFPSELDGPEAESLQSRLERVSQAIEECPARPGEYVPWHKILDAAQGLSDIFKVQGAMCDVQQLNDDNCRHIRECWIQAYQWLAKPFSAFWRFQREAAEVEFLLPEFSYRLPDYVSGLDFLKPVRNCERPRLKDAYHDADANGNGDAPLSPPLARLMRQLQHARAYMHLRLAFLVPHDPHADPRQRNGLIGDRDGKPFLTAPFAVDGYLRSLRDALDSPEFAKLNSATIRAACNWCRLFVLRNLLHGPVADGLLRMMQGSQKSWVQRLAQQRMLPRTAQLLLFWEGADSIVRLRSLVDGVQRQLAGESNYLLVPSAEPERTQLEKLAGRLQSDDTDTPAAVKAAQHEFLHILVEFQHEIKNHYRNAPPAGRPEQDHQTELPFHLFPKPVRGKMKDVVDCYQRALAVLLVHPENDLFESVLNRITVREALRDAVWFFSDQKRTAFESLRSHQDEVERLFIDLDQLNNPQLTTWVRKSFYPAWGDVHTALKEIQDNLRRLRESFLKQTEEADDDTEFNCSGCGTRVRVPGHLTGAKVCCPECGAVAP